MVAPSVGAVRFLSNLENSLTDVPVARTMLVTNKRDLFPDMYDNRPCDRGIETRFAPLAS